IEADDPRRQTCGRNDVVQHELLRRIGRDTPPDEVYGRRREHVPLANADQDAGRWIDASLHLGHVAGQSRADPVDALDAPVPELVLPDREVVSAGPDRGDVRVPPDGAVDPALAYLPDPLRVGTAREPRETVRPALDRKPRPAKADGDERRQCGCVSAR